MQKAAIKLVNLTPVETKDGIVFVAMGYVYDHPRFFEGQYIRTSRIQKINLKKGTFETRNTKYKIEVFPAQDHLRICLP